MSVQRESVGCVDGSVGCVWMGVWGVWRGECVGVWSIGCVWRGSCVGGVRRECRVWRGWGV